MADLKLIVKGDVEQLKRDLRRAFDDIKNIPINITAQINLNFANILISFRKVWQGSRRASLAFGCKE